MRLLHTKTLQLREFFGDATPAYAILSHTWGPQEVTFQNIQTTDLKGNAGYTKIRRCCEQAARDGFEFVWIDTCCIDKSSSAELSEAINSMYTWYKNAKTCYAYLADVPPLDGRLLLVEISIHIMASKWFTRGWTLQELIAPVSVEFFARDWTPIGTKEELSDALSHITGIDEPTLKGRDVKEVSVAKRMSWASKRVTTRIEDLAYCLIGIFGVNLPLLYGEGERAFIRLQEEIMKSSDDQSLFAWEDKSGTQEVPREPSYQLFSTSDTDLEIRLPVPETTLRPQTRNLRGFLARSPAEFENSGNVIPYRNWDISTPYSMTNQGLRMKLSLFQYDYSQDFVAILACHFENNFLGPLGVYIQPLASLEGDQFAREISHAKPVIVIPEHVSRAITRTVYIRQEVLLPSARDFDRKDHFLIRTVPESSFVLSNVYPAEHWNKSQKIIRSPNRAGALLFQYQDKLDNPKPLPFLVIVRGDLFHEGAKDRAFNYSCQIIVDPSVSGNELLEAVVKTTPLEHPKSTYQVLNPWDRLHEEKAFARISREVFSTSFRLLPTLIRTGEWA